MKPPLWSRFRRGPKLVENEIVTVTGIARTVRDHFVAPLSGKPCVAYRARAYLVGESRERESGEGSVLYGKVPAGLDKNFEEERRTAFNLETSHGTIHVDDDALEIAATPERVIPRQQDRERAFLAKLGAADKHDKAGFDEIAVAVDAKVTVRGMLRIEVDPAATDERGYRDASPTRMRLVAAGDTPLTVLRVWAP